MRKIAGYAATGITRNTEKWRHIEATNNGRIGASNSMQHPANSKQHLLHKWIRFNVYTNLE